jgi:ribose-phosphate pyrophosphokinase
MTRPILIPLPGNRAMAETLASLLGGEVKLPALRSFPDGETYLRLDTDLHGRNVAIVCTLDRPDAKLLPLLFAAGTVSDLGAASVGLVAPYLAYMRQDRRFRPGEAVSARLFASLLSPHFDWIVTVDPHLHRIRSLSAVYDVPSRLIQAAVPIAEWIAKEISRPVLFGPDSESVQWVADVAARTGAPVVTLNKVRHGDMEVSIGSGDLSAWVSHTPVLVDDIISTGHTMLETMRVLREAGLRPPVCIGVHAIFSGTAYDDLRAASPARIVTTNTVAHPTNAIDIAPLMTNEMCELMT